MVYSSRKDDLLSSGLIFPSKLSIEHIAFKLNFEGKGRIQQVGKRVKPQLMWTHQDIGTFLTYICMDHEIHIFTNIMLLTSSAWKYFFLRKSLSILSCSLFIVTSLQFWNSFSSRQMTSVWYLSITREEDISQCENIFLTFKRFCIPSSTLKN